MYHSTVMLNGSNIDFVNNSAQNLGGGIGIALSTMQMGAGTIGNAAVSQQGGAFASANSNLEMSSLNFINNTAGEELAEQWSLLRII